MTTITSSTRLKAKLFRGLADTSRLGVLECLMHQPRCVSELVAMTGLSQPNVSNHLSCLWDCGLVEREQQGRFVFYRLADPGIEAILVEAETLLGIVASSVEACPNYWEREEAT